MKTAAIYTRKSVYTGKGESIENQVKVCKEHLSRSNVSNFLIYEDEGFSGKNVDRPKFQKMLKDAKEKKFDILICYRLDRVSRNIADFASLIQELEKNDISFISVAEQFDTSTPMGRAMMYIASVFAQLERETIAERVRDNMLELAKSGRWLGGRTPTGFESIPVTIYDDNLNERKMFKLSPIDEEMQLVKLIYNKYLEKKSASQVVKYLLSHNLKTKLDNDWTKSNVTAILANPVYVRATDGVIRYLNKKDIETIGTPDGIHGMLSYNKRKGKTGPYREVNEWIYAIAKHEGIINGDDWIKVQNILSENFGKAPRLGKTHTALLTGIMRCAKCGSTMRVAYGSLDKNTGKRRYYYVCTMKRNSGNTRCDNKNAPGELVEVLLIDKLKDMTIDEGVFIKELKEQQRKLQDDNLIKDEIEGIEKEIALKQSSSENLLKSLQLTNDLNTSKILIDKIEALSKEKASLELRLKELRSEKKETDKDIVTLDYAIKSLRNFKSLIDISNLEERKLLISSIVKRIYWDGDTQVMDVRFWTE